MAKNNKTLNWVGVEGGVDLGKGEYDQKMLYKFLRYYYINNNILVLYTLYVIQAMGKMGVVLYLGRAIGGQYRRKRGGEENNTQRMPTET